MDDSEGPLNRARGYQAIAGKVRHITLSNLCHFLHEKQLYILLNSYFMSQAKPSSLTPHCLSLQRLPCMASLMDRHSSVQWLPSQADQAGYGMCNYLMRPFVVIGMSVNTGYQPPTHLQWLCHRDPSSLHSSLGMDTSQEPKPFAWVNKEHICGRDPMVWTRNSIQFLCTVRAS